MKRRDMAIGQRVEFRCDLVPRWIVGTVRAFSDRRGRPEVRVDDGDPANPNPTTNGFTVTAWVTPRRIREVSP